MADAQRDKPFFPRVAIRSPLVRLRHPKHVVMLAFVFSPGVDRAWMSVSPDPILASYLRMRVAAIVHDDVLDDVARAVRRGASFFRDALTAMVF